MTIDAYLHKKGSDQAPNRSEYEVETSGIHEIILVENATIFDKCVFQVIDERKPVYAIITSIYKGEIWRFEDHLKKNSSSKCCAKVVLSSDIGAMITTKTSADVLDFIKLRVGNKVYFAGNSSLAEEIVNLVSLGDLLKFVSGEISWGNLENRSRIFKKEKEMKTLRDKRVSELNRVIAGLRRKNETPEGVLCWANEELEVFGRNFDLTNKENKDLARDLYWANEELEVFVRDFHLANVKLSKIPLWVKWIFSAE